MPATIHCAISTTPIKICQSHVTRRATCSNLCRVKWQRHFEVTPEELLIAVWSEPATAVARSFDVSDKAIEKRCRRLGVVKPPRGYWVKLGIGISHKEALFELGWLWEEIDTLNEKLAAAKDHAAASKQIQSRREVAINDTGHNSK